VDGVYIAAVRCDGRRQAVRSSVSKVGCLSALLLLETLALNQDAALQQIKSWLR
jgi:hypothetical protein